MIRILSIIPSAYIGGLQIMTLRLFERLSPEFDSHFLLTRWTDGELARLLDQQKIQYSYSWLGMFSRKLDQRNLQMSLHCMSKMPLLYQDFIQLLRVYHPHIIYVAGYREVILLLPILHTIKLPIIYHVHNLLPTSTFYSNSFAFWGKVVTHYFSVSRPVQSSIEKLGVGKEKISLLYNGIQLEHFPCRDKRSDYLLSCYAWPQDTIIIGMTGQMIAHKGHDDFLLAAHKLYQEFPHIRFVIGGHTVGEYYEHLQCRVKQLGLDKVVIFSGWQADMNSFYTNLDIFVFPSHPISEGFGLVVIEAMAVGVPVVATRAGASEEIIEDGKNGLLVDPLAPDQLVSSIRTLIQSPDLRLQFSKWGWETVRATFGLTQQATKFEKTIKEVIQAYAH